jgi:hypothetical protein
VPHIASWISPKFAIFVSQIIREWRAISSFNETLFWTKVGDCVINHPYSSDQEERKWQEIVAARENGEREVETSCGRIDVLSATKVIEVKRAALWKAAVGQVLCYLEEYENRKASLYLFDAAEAPKDIIEKCCKRLNVEVNYL